MLDGGFASGDAATACKDDDPLSRYAAVLGTNIRLALKIPLRPVIPAHWPYTAAPVPGARRWRSSAPDDI